MLCKSVCEEDQMFLKYNEMWLKLHLNNNNYQHLSILRSRLLVDGSWEWWMSWSQVGVDGAGEPRYTGWGNLYLHRVTTGGVRKSLSSQGDHRWSNFAMLSQRENLYPRCNWQVITAKFPRSDISCYSLTKLQWDWWRLPSVWLHSVLSCHWRRTLTFVLCCPAVCVTAGTDCFNVWDGTVKFQVLTLWKGLM